MFEVKCYDDYVEHLVEHARKKGYRVSKRLVRNLLRAHFREMYARIASKQDLFIHDFMLLVLRKDYFFKRRYEKTPEYLKFLEKEVASPIYTAAELLYSEEQEAQRETVE